MSASYQRRVSDARNEEALVHQLPDEVIVSKRQRLLEGVSKSAVVDDLPDEVIFAFLSLLPLKEAGRCGVLSRRWKQLWRSFPGMLDFDGSDMRLGLCPDGDTAQREYVRWVNQVLKLHRAPSVDGLRICFCLDDKYSGDIDGWIDFAMEKKVKSFELDLSCQGFCFRWMMDSYTLSSKALSKASGFSSLKDLRLVNSSVSNEVMEHLLSNCPLLEQLSLVSLESLTDLKICGTTPALKRLEVVCCDLVTFEVTAMNLMSCTYSGGFIGIPFKNVPLLSVLCVGDSYCESLLIRSSKHSSYLPQIRTLKLILPLGFTPFAATCPELYHLTELELDLLAGRGCNLIYYTSLIKGSPFLRIFRVKLGLGLGEGELLGLEEEDAVYSRGTMEGRLPTYEEAREATRFRHKNLKLIEIKGFVGCEADFELALHLLEIAVSLEKIIIVSDTFSGLSQRKRFQTEARVRARKLQPKLPPGSELLIL